MGRAKEIIVKVIPAKIANEFVKKHHYSGKVVNYSQVHFGCFLDNKLHGVLSYGGSVNKRALLSLVENAEWNIVLDAELVEAELGEAVCEEWGVEIGVSDEFGTDFNLPDGDKPPFQQMTFTLADEQAEQIKNAIADIKKIGTIYKENECQN